MTDAHASELEAHLQRALLSADRLFLALEEIEAAGGLASALAGRRPASRDEVLARLRSARDQLAATLKPVDLAPPRPARRSCGGGRTGRRSPWYNGSRGIRPNEPSPTPEDPPWPAPQHDRPAVRWMPRAAPSP